MRAFNFKVHFRAAPSNLHLLIGNYFPNRFVKSFLWGDGETVSSYTLRMHWKQTKRIVNCKLALDWLKKKNLPERGNATRKLLLKLLENFFSWQNSQGTQMRRILLWSKTPQSVRAPKACRRLEYCLHLALNLTSTHFKILNTLHSFSCKSFFLSYSSWFSRVKTVIQNQVFWLRWLKLFG